MYFTRLYCQDVQRALELPVCFPSDTRDRPTTSVQTWTTSTPGAALVLTTRGTLWTPSGDTVNRPVHDENEEFILSYKNFLFINKNMNY